MRIESVKKLEVHCDGCQDAVPEWRYRVPVGLLLFDSPPCVSSGWAGFCSTCRDLLELSRTAAPRVLTERAAQSKLALRLDEERRRAFCAMILSMMERLVPNLSAEPVPLVIGEDPTDGKLIYLSPERDPRQDSN